MDMNKARVTIAVSFLLAFAAGTTVGILVGRSANIHGRSSWLARELALTAAQREQMREIWSELTGTMRRQQRQEREVLQKEREDAVKALLTVDQQGRYEEVMQEYARKSATLSQERRKVFQEAVERTKLLLTESQRKKYDELLRKEPMRGQRDGYRRTESSRGDTPRVPRGEE